MCIRRELFACPFWTKKKGGARQSPLNKSWLESRICWMNPIPILRHSRKLFNFLSITRRSINSVFNRKRERTLRAPKRCLIYGKSEIQFTFVASQRGISTLYREKTPESSGNPDSNQPTFHVWNKLLDPISQNSFFVGRWNEETCLSCFVFRRTAERGDIRVL